MKTSSQLYLIAHASEYKSSRRFYIEYILWNSFSDKIVQRAFIDYVLFH